MKQTQYRPSKTTQLGEKGVFAQRLRRRRRLLIGLGIDFGSWTGTTGIRSSKAAAEPNHRTALGFAEASDIGSLPAMFAGQMVSSPSVLVRYSLRGDANLDQAVNTIDFNLLATNFGASGKRWTQGDFDYNGSVDTIDFNLLASNFSLHLPAPDLGTLIPEPGTAILAALVVAAISQRRRRDLL